MADQKLGLLEQIEGHTLPDAAPRPVDLGEVELRSAGERYGMHGRLGAGSMGEVRLCRDERIGREVAMKVILPERRDDGQACARFIHEARIQGQLEHPSIVPVYDLAGDESGGAFFTMKCVRGLTLRKIVDGLRAGDPELARTCSRRRLLTAFSSLCLAVDFAHSRGVLHRDIKPTNIMLGDFGEVYLLDWGIAKVGGVREQSHQQPPDLVDEELVETAHGRIMGTFGYMAPEQARGRDLDARSDVYSLGAILFELLTYQPLHEKGEWKEMLLSTIAGADAHASGRAPERRIPPELDVICVKATRVRPDERYRNARELHLAVERFLDGDRDVELRRAMALRHVQTMQTLAIRALDGGPESETARREVLREIGSVLALDPTNEEALRTLRRVVTEPPREPPAEVCAEAAAVITRRERGVLRDGLRSELFGMCLTLLIAVWMGVRYWPGIALIGVFTLVSAGAKLAAMRAPPGEARRAHTLAFFAFLLNLGAIVLAGRSFGPLLFVPLPLVVFTAANSLARARWYRRAVLVAGSLAFVAPAALELAGVLPRSYAFHDGALTILPRFVELPPTATQVALLCAGLFMIVIPAILVGRLQRALDRAQSSILVNAWHLRQLLP